MTEKIFSFPEAERVLGVILSRERSLSGTYERFLTGVRRRFKEKGIQIKMDAETFFQNLEVAFDTGCLVAVIGLASEKSSEVREKEVTIIFELKKSIFP